LTGIAGAIDSVKLAAPVGPLAKNGICVGKNHPDHAQKFARSGVDQSGDKQEVPADPFVFTKAAIIEAVSACVTLEPGDLIATGTPAAVGIGFSPQRFLAPGDVVPIAISGIGELTNPVV
jgi:2-keto-4-pentenoate hydratase/2-oxohepta-3-ene-1,7-dioic acid hydratase in catechol pathway